jgi:hypothetical protein
MWWSKWGQRQVLTFPKCSARNILPSLMKPSPWTGCSQVGCSSAFFLRRGGLVMTHSRSNWNLWTECWRMPYRFPMVQRTRKQQTSSKLNNKLSLLRWYKQKYLQKQPANLRYLLQWGKTQTTINLWQPLICFNNMFVWSICQQVCTRAAAPIPPIILEAHVTEMGNKCMRFLENRQANCFNQVILITV